MQFTPLAIPAVVAIQPLVFEDARGFFLESYHREQFLEAGLPVDFVQDNHSGSRRGSLRGLHYQIRQRLIGGLGTSCLANGLPSYASVGWTPSETCPREQESE